LGLVLSIGFIDLTIAFGTTNTSIFLLRQVSTKWLILPQLVQVNVDLVVTVGHLKTPKKKPNFGGNTHVTLNP
jgi:predicted membrane protein